MKSHALLAASLAAYSLSSALAQPWPRADGGMEHIFVSFDGAAIDVQLEHPDRLPLPMLNHGERYSPPADVLNDKGYSSQLGWLAFGTWAPPSGSSVWVRVLDQTDGLETYRGGMRSMIPQHTFEPLFGTAGSAAIWRWPGSMVHNWYAAAVPGTYQATYEVYLGDATGIRNPAYGADTVRLAWNYVPEPSGSTAAVLALALLARWRKAVR